jgi:hypothetical protein
VAQLYPRAFGSLFVASYDSQDYGGGILTRPTVIKVRRKRWAEHVARKGEKRNVYRLLVGKPEGRRPLRRPRHRWLDIRMDLVEVGWGDVDWIGLPQDRDRWRALVNSVLNLRVP